MRLRDDTGGGGDSGGDFRRHHRFRSQPARATSLPATRHGIWRYHFGDRRLYPLGSGFLREIIDGLPLTGIELIQLGPVVQEDVTLMRALFRTIPFPSRQANRFAPLWGARHFVIQCLWTLSQGSPESVADPEVMNIPRVPGQACSDGNAIWSMDVG